MKKATIAIVTFLLFLTLILGVFLWKKSSIDNPDPINSSSSEASEVKIINKNPEIFINGKQLDSGLTEIFYFPPRGDNKGPAYGSAEYIRNMKDLIDKSVRHNNRIIFLNIWWSDLDQSASRPKNIGDNFNFSPLDQIFDYAREKGAYIVPNTFLWPYAPDWWKKENNIPPFRNNKICDFCETDNLGNVYDNPSMNSDIVQKDFGAYLRVIVSHYKNNPALFGWRRGVGSTAEDNYGPNYITLLNPANNSGLNENVRKDTAMYTDYSPFFQRKFKEWIKEKYGTDQELQKSWNDTAVSFSNFQIPKPDELINKGATAPKFFPDPGGMNSIFVDKDGVTDTSMLTRKGLDFYEFRNQMRAEDRRFYSRLIKTEDPDHVLIMGGNSEEFMGQIKKQGLADGIIWNLPAAKDKFEEGLMHYLGTDVVKRATNHGLAAFIPQDGYGLSGYNGQTETEDNLFYTENVGKVIKCAGGIYGPTFSPFSQEYLQSKNWLAPAWYSKNMLSVAQKISSYSPGNECLCPLLDNMYAKNQCTTDPKGLSCNSLDRARLSSGCIKNISNKSDNFTKNQSGGKCGDGICDDFEKSHNQCTQDCHK